MWERQICDRNLLKTVDICFQSTYFFHFSPKNKFLWFSWKHMYVPCFQSKHSSQGLEKGLKMSTVCQENGIFQVPKWFIFIFPVKKAVKRLFWTDFRIFTPEPISIYTTISIKEFFIKSFNDKVKVHCLSQVNQLLCALLTYKPQEKLNISSTVSFQLVKKFYK